MGKALLLIIGICLAGLIFSHYSGGSFTNITSMINQHHEQNLDIQAYSKENLLPEGY